jgi:hypothetical protein
MTRRVDIDKEFAVVVKKCGGLVLDDELGGNRPFANADFIFHESKVIAEMKRLHEDKSEDPEMKQKLGELWTSWCERGLVQGPTPPLIDSKKVPQQCQHEMIRTMGESIRRRIKKANAQIKATKAAMNLPDYHGMLFLANDGNFIMEFPALIPLAYRAIKHDFHEIDSISLFSGNIVSWVEGVVGPTKMWFNLHRDDAILPLAKLAERMGEEWGKHYSAVMGTPFAMSEVGDMEFFNRKMTSRPF